MNAVLNETPVQNILNLGKEMQTIGLNDLVQFQQLMSRLYTEIPKVSNKEFKMNFLKTLLDLLWEIKTPMGTPEWGVLFDVKHKLTGLLYEANLS